MNTYIENILIIDKEDVKRYRLRMAQDALKFGIKPCAQAYQTTVKTVRKWVKRYQENKEAGLSDLPGRKSTVLSRLIRRRS